MHALLSRRWFRFSLRTMFVAFTLVAVWLGWNVYIVRQRTAKLAEFAADPFHVIVTTRAEYEALYNNNVLKTPMPQVSRIRWLLGDEPVYRIYFPGWLGVSDAEFNATAEMFPEARLDSLWRPDREPTR